ncbi:MAG: MFS transporter [Gammaproteobacteria bacterium]|nr:MFS transporter [Gammaproteobacteria bacterium]
MTERSSSQIATLINQGPMSGTQKLVVAFAIVLHMLDGFDILVMSFTATDISATWDLSASQLGVLLSSGLIGMALGSMFLAPLADKFGRRNLILLSLSFITAGMLLSSVSQNMVLFGVMRLLTGFGIGGILVNLTVITAEFTSDKWRTLCLTLFASGFPLGAILSGGIAVVLIADFGWRAVFLFGGICSGVMIPVVYKLLPESLDYLLGQRRPGTLEKVNKVLGRMGHQPINELPELPAAQASNESKLRQLFSANIRRSTLLFWIAIFAVLFNFYFVMSWTPRLLTAAGLSAEQGISGGVALNLGGIIGSLTLGYLAAFLNLQRLIAVFMLLAIVFTVAFSQFYTELIIALVLATGIGFMLNAAIAGLFALGPSLYPVSIRSTGMGWAIGVGRVGALISPIVAGSLLDKGWETASLYNLFAVSLLISMVSVFIIKRAASQAP